MNDFLAATTWEAIDVEAVWRSLDQSLNYLDTPTQIQFVSRASEHLVELFVTSRLIFQDRGFPVVSCEGEEIEDSTVLVDRCALLL